MKIAQEGISVVNLNEKTTKTIKSKRVKPKKKSSINLDTDE